MVLYVQQLLRMASVTLSDVQKLTGLSWPTLKKIDKAQLKFCYENVSFNGVQNIAIDEFSIHKGHRYATVVIDNDTCRVLWASKGKSKAAVQPFFDLLKERGVALNIRSVACDQNAAYPSLVRDNLPNATIVYDLFHVMANWRRDVLKPAKEQSLRNAVQRLKTQAQELAQSNNGIVNKDVLNTKIRAAHRQCANSDWNMLQPLDNNDSQRRRKQEKRLADLMQDNALLAALYPVAEAIRHLWREKSPLQAQQNLQNLRLILLQINRTFDFKPAKRFAMMLGRRMEGIVKAGTFGFTTNRLEGANNKIKVLKRVAYGYRDHEYFFLKIKSAFPGKFNIPMYDRLKGVAVINNRLWIPPWNPCCNHAQV